MTTVTPSTNPVLPQMLAATAAPMATIANPPPAVAALPPGATLTGTVTPGPNPQTVMLATADGDVPLRTPVPVPDGAELTVEVVRTSQAQTTVRLVSVDGQALQQALAQGAKQPIPTPLPPTPQQPVQTALPTAPGTPTPLPTGQAWSPSGPQPLTQLPQISAYVVAGGETSPTASPTPGPAPGPTPQSLLLTPGTELSLRVTSLILPSASSAAVAAAPATPISSPGVTPQPLANTPAVATATPAVSTPGATPSGQPTGTPVALQTTPTPSAPTPPPGTPAPETTAAPVPTTGAPAPPAISTPGAVPLTPATTAASTDAATSLPPENQDLVLTNRDGWPQPAPTPPATVTPTASLSVITGTVVTSPDGVPVVQTPDGQIQLNVRANLPPGTVVTLEVTAQRAPSQLMTPPAPLPAPATLPLAAQTTGWPTLSEAAEALQRSDPAMAAPFANIIPDGGPRSALAMMAIAQAMRSGEPRQWPGDGNLRALERIGPRGAHLANQLADEVTELSRQVREPPGDWRALPIPWQSDGRVERIRLVVRETDGDEEARKRKGGGGGTRFLLDLDLSRLGPLQLDGMFRKETRSFDMMVRTHAPLPETMRTDLAGLFANANAAMNLVGGLSFQVVKKFPDPLAGAGGSPEKSGLWV